MVERCMDVPGRRAGSLLYTAFHAIAGRKELVGVGRTIGGRF